MSQLMPRVVIAGLSGGSGKTMISVGLARAFANRGLRVQTFKKGPDYIDTLWLSLAGGLPPRNLEPFLTPGGQLPYMFEQAWLAGTPDLAIIEGNRGFYDGQDINGSCSTAEVARQLDAPVVLAMNSGKMTRTAAAVVFGLKHFERDVNLAGVIFNQASRNRHRRMLTDSVEQLTGTPVFGSLPRLEYPPLEERRNGLMAEEAVLQLPGAFERLDELAALVEEHLDLDGILRLARSAPPLSVPVRPGSDAESEAEQDAQPEHTGPRPRIGYVRDAALWFYYTENLEALERAGADLVPVSILEDAPWPDLHGLYMGGGLPEDYAITLSGNQTVQQTLKNLVANGLPVYAEGSGIYFLANEIKVGGVAYPMCGVFDVSLEIGEKPRGIGYVEAAARVPNPFHMLEQPIRGHEFHYCRLGGEKIISGGAVLSMTRGTGLDAVGDRPGQDGMLMSNCLGSLMQIYAPGAPWWAPNFVKAAATYAEKGRANRIRA